MMKIKRKEKLVCSCDIVDEKKHKSTIDAHGETVVKCEECNRFIKFPVTTVIW